MIYVDDLLITCEDEKAIQDLADQLRQEYGAITLQQDDDMSYVENVLQDYPVDTSVSTPANQNLFSFPGEEDSSRYIVGSVFPVHASEESIPI